MSWEQFYVKFTPQTRHIKRSMSIYNEIYDVLFLMQELNILFVTILRPFKYNFLAKDNYKTFLLAQNIY